MNLDLDDDQAAIDALFAALFAKECTPAAVRASEATGFSPELWEHLRAAGAPSMSVGAGVGGGGAGLLEAAIVAEIAGRHLAPVPLVEHVVTTRLLERAGAGDALRDAVAATLPCTLALHPVRERGAAHPTVVTARAHRAEGTGTSGAASRHATLPSAMHVPGGAVASMFVARRRDDVVLVRTEGERLPSPNSAGLSIADLPIVGPEVLQGADAAVYTRAIDEWKLLTAATLVGLASAALDLGVAYVCGRQQFGVPIGSFQALQHGLAEFPGQLSGARLLTLRAAWRADRHQDMVDSTLSVDASMAFLFATDLARTVTSRAMHYHGGYGVMEETDIQLHYRRARAWPAVLGDPATELDRLADRLYGTGVAG